MKKLLLLICLIGTIVMLQNNLGFEARYDLILENPPVGYSPSGDPVIVAQGTLTPGQRHEIGEFKDCPDPVFKIIWTVGNQVIKYQAPPLNDKWRVIVLKPLSFSLFSDVKRLDDET